MHYSLFLQLNDHRTGVVEGAQVMKNLNTVSFDVNVFGSLP